MSSPRLFKIPKLPFSSSSLLSPSSLFFSNPISFQPIPPKKPPPLPLPTSSSCPLQPLEHLPPKLKDIISLFQSVPDPKSRYQQLLFYAQNLKPLDTHFKTSENRVEGCVSQVWVRAYLDSHQNVVFEADSDTLLTKGIAALFVQGLSGCPVEEIVKVSPHFVVLLGLQQSLTPSRNNGFLNMLNLMQKKAVEAVMEAQKGKGLDLVSFGHKGGNFEVVGRGSGLNSQDNGSVGMDSGVGSSVVEERKQEG